VRAAIDLSISQPSISKAIADVEHAVGIRLLDRGPQGIEPTIYGRALLKCGTAVFDELRHGVDGDPARFVAAMLASAIKLVEKIVPVT
jgi:DNA-binding transcriptional LysR family regulator